MLNVLIQQRINKEKGHQKTFGGNGYVYKVDHSDDGLEAQSVKNSPAVQETWIQSLGWEDPLEKEMATHSSILAWRIPKNRGAWWATVHGVTKNQIRLSN